MIRHYHETHNLKDGISTCLQLADDTRSLEMLIRFGYPFLKKHEEIILERFEKAKKGPQRGREERMQLPQRLRIMYLSEVTAQINLFAEDSDVAMMIFTMVTGSAIHKAGA